MSHWTRSKVEIKDLRKLKKVAQKLGCKVTESKQFSSRYAGTVDAELVLSANGGQCAVVKQGDHYSTIIDSYNNPITSVVGYDCATLNKEYTAEVVRSSAMMMGGVVSNEKTLQDGSLEIHISL